MVFDLEKKLHFSEIVISSILRIDMVIWAKEVNKIITLQLRLSWDEDCKETAKRKANNYDGINVFVAIK